MKNLRKKKILNWYSNVNSSLKLYDYIEKGSLIGESLNNNIYLVYKKDGKVLNYEDYRS